MHGTSTKTESLEQKDSDRNSYSWVLTKLSKVFSREKTASVTKGKTLELDMTNAPRSSCFGLYNHQLEM